MSGTARSPEGVGGLWSKRRNPAGNARGSPLYDSGWLLTSNSNIPSPLKLEHFFGNLSLEGRRTHLIGKRKESKRHLFISESQ